VWAITPAFILSSGTPGNVSRFAADSQLQHDSVPVLSAPGAIAGLSKLREARRAAEAWLERVGPILQDTDMPVELRTVEGLVADGRRLWVALDQVDALKMRMSAARRLADEVSPGGMRPRSML